MSKLDQIIRTGRDGTALLFRPRPYREKEQAVFLRDVIALANAEVSFPLGISSLLGSFFIEAGTVGLLDGSDKYNVITGFTDNTLTNLFTTGSSCEGITVAGVICERTEDGLDPRVTAGMSIFWESPFGPIRFDFTQPLVQQPYDDRKSFQFTTRTRF